jgi:hypothetical protein
MFKPFTICAFLAALTAASAAAQNLPSTHSQFDQFSSSAVAYVYVAAGTRNGNPNSVIGYSASSTGALTPISGSPFAQNVSSMAVNGKFLMAVDNANPPNIDTLRIGSNGALTYVTSIPCVQPNNDCIAARRLFFDHTGSDLYVMELQGDENSNTASYAVNQSSGALSYLGNTITGAFPGDYTGTFFIGNNVYAYSADQSACMYPNIYAFQRESGGFLNSIASQFNPSNQPTPPPGVSIYYPDLTVADPANNLAFLEQPANPPGCAPGPIQIAVYTADASGNISTKSTYKDMPATKIQSPFDMKMSPSGQLLAVAGQEGLQVFHFNGSNPVTHYTGLLTREPISQMFWDNADHLYAISNRALLVFTITPTTHQKAPGSPHPITGPQDIIVQPLN